MGHNPASQHTPLQGNPGPAVTPKSVKVNITAGTGVDIDWKDAHQSHYSFQFLRDACPCAMCDDERIKQGRKPGDGEKLAPGALPLFKPAMKPTSASGVGKYAIQFKWNDGHEAGIYSWEYLREWCPCPECRAKWEANSPTASGAVQ
jgi:DUF971 family protein